MLSMLTALRVSVIMNANIAGIYGAQIFRADDNPLYRRGFSVALAVLSVGLALAMIRFIDTLVQRRRRTEAVAGVPSTGEQSH